MSSDCMSGPREILAPAEFGKKYIKYDIKFDRYGLLVPVCDGVIYSAKEPLTKEEELMADYMIRLLKDEDLWNCCSK